VSLTARVLIGLLVGIAAGVWISITRSPSLLALVSPVETVGTLWINAIRMTVIPLVMSSLIVGVAASSGGRSIGQVGWRALVIFVLVLLAAAVFATVVGMPLFERVVVSPDVSESLRASGERMSTDLVERARTAPGFRDWLVDLVPPNPVRAAADGAMLPLIVFSIAFGIALTRVADERRRVVVSLFQGIFDAMLVLVRWVLVLAPIGVFALVLPLATRLGVSAIGALGWYIGIVAALSVAFMLLVLYPMAAIFGGVSVGRFARAALPAQAVAFSARSSLASLPAMMESSAARLRHPGEVTTFFLPLAASVFRAGAGIGMPLGVLFVARLYGVELSPSQMASVVLTVVLTSFSIPGIPAGSIIVMLPVMMAAGIPVAGAGILLGADTIPDMFRTTTNVTGDMSAATVLARHHPAAIGEPAASPAA
jgi:Na+/H+-dicarboxylate symporter